VYGVGFRGKSEVNLRVGDAKAVNVRVDPNGTLTMDVPHAESADAVPGTSVLALGRGPSGATRTLIGAVPPLPSGLGPAQFVPWIVAVAAALAAGVWAVRRVSASR
jgi:lysozyme family protein